MLNQKVYGALKETLDQFVMDFNEKQLDIGLISGNVEMKNLILRADAINQILAAANVPIQLKAGMVGKIRVKVGNSLARCFIIIVITAFVAELAQHVFGPCPRDSRRCALYSGTEAIATKGQVGACKFKL